jgi:two-component system, OmpR family, phosphate regulon sensor histidine kinase PhoR
LRSVFARIAAGYLLVTVLVLGGLLVFLHGAVRRHYLDGQRDKLEDVGLAGATELASRLAAGRGIDSFVRSLGESTGLRVTVIAPDGVVLADSREDARTMENHAARPEVIQALAGRTGSDIRASRTLKRSMLYVAVSARDRDRVVAVLRTSEDLSRIAAIQARLTRQVLLAAIVLALMAAALAFLMARNVGRPVTELGQAFRQVGSGRFDVRVPAGRGDELGELASGFNEMVEMLRALAEEQRRNQEALVQVVNSIQEGIVVLDHSGLVKLCNKSFLAIANLDAAVGKHHWEVTREFRLGELAAGSAGGGVWTADTEVNGRDYVCSAAFIPSTGDTVISFHDVSELKRADRVKRDLVANVSHELRTPLTTIKGYLETVLETAAGDERRYLETCLRNTDRLISIVGDLLLLSELEEPDTKLALERTDLGRLAEGAAATFEMRARGKGIKLETDVAPGVFIPLDPFKFEQVVVNLLDNAVKYTEQGSVWLAVQKSGAGARLTVSDTGVGIPRELQDRVFERFFVVDKGRARAAGGTGLGLAIVKHVVQLHGGTIELKSEPGAGTTVTITLPGAPEPPEAAA